jgi:hypothetical protein
MGSRPGFYKSGKRNKELARQKKQEEKKLRRLNKTPVGGEETPETFLEDPDSGKEKEGPDDPDKLETFPL